MKNYENFILSNENFKKYENVVLLPSKEVEKIDILIQNQRLSNFFLFGFCLILSIFFLTWLFKELFKK